MKSLVIHGTDGQQVIIVLYPSWSEESLAKEIEGCEKAGLKYEVHNYNVLNMTSSQN